MNNFSKVIFLGLAVGFLNPAIADDTLNGGGYKNKSSDFPRHVTASESPGAPVAAETGHHNDGGQDRSGRDWVKGVTPSESPGAPVAAETGHHNDGGQDRSGRDWVKGVTPQGQ